MREIKFRAWDKRSKFMDTELLIDLWSGGLWDYARVAHDTPNTEIVKARNDYILMQYTGLKDKLGNEIYEGDIVHYDYQPGEGYWNHKQNGIIEWNITGFFFHGIPHGLQTWLVSLPGGGGDKNGMVNLMKIIGNIHENPELLK